MSELDTYPHDYAGEAAEPPATPTAAEVEEGRRIVAELHAAEPVEAPRFGAAPWRVARSLEVLGAEANATNPNRDRRSDGTIGDAAHATRSSDHNPWVIVEGWGVVRARDIDVDGLDIAGAFERARIAAVEGRLPQLVGGGYLILNRRITSPDFSRWNAYTGPNPHTSHGHVSVSLARAQFDDGRGWGIFTAAAAPAPLPPAPAPPPVRWPGPDLTGSGHSLRGDEGNSGPRVERLQADLRRLFPLYAKHLAVDGWWGAQTRGVIDEFGRRSSIPEADGRNIGPKLARALWNEGVRP